MLQELKLGRRALEMFYFLFKTAFRLRWWCSCVLTWGVRMKLGHTAVQVLLWVEVPAVHWALFLRFFALLCTPGKVQPEQARSGTEGLGGRYYHRALRATSSTVPPAAAWAKWNCFFVSLGTPPLCKRASQRREDGKEDKTFCLEPWHMYFVAESMVVCNWKGTESYFPSQSSSWRDAPLCGSAKGFGFFLNFGFS